MSSSQNTEQQTEQQTQVPTDAVDFESTQNPNATAAKSRGIVLVEETQPRDDAEEAPHALLHLSTMMKNLIKDTEPEDSTQKEKQRQ